MKDTGGPAFPTIPENYMGMDPPGEGMTLRDYFAAKAMQSFCSAYTRAPHSSTEEWLDSISTRAYMIADAMLKARNQ